VESEQLRYRGQLQLDYLYLARFDARVTSILPNPFTIRYRYGRSRLRYTPAYLIIEDSHEVLVDCTLKASLADDEVKRRISAATEWCEEHGYEFRMLTEEKIRNGHLLKNVKRLMRYTRHVVGPDFRAQLYSILEGEPRGIPIGQLAEKLSQAPDDVTDTVQSICHLATLHEVELAIEDAPLGVNTRVWLPYHLKHASTSGVGTPNQTQMKA
jgi:hypothetical protein